MTALSSDKYTFKIGNTERAIPVKASSLIYKGAMVAVGSDGYAVEASTATGLTVVGVAVRQADNSSGSNGDIDVQVEIGIFPMENSADSDELDWSDVGSVVFAVDDQTVAKTDGGSTRSAAGVLWAMDRKTGKPLISFE